VSAEHRERAQKFLEVFCEEIPEPEDLVDLVDHLTEHFDQVDRHAEDRGRRLQSAETVPGFRVVDTDNFGGDYPDEKFVAVGIEREVAAQLLADALNSYAGEHAARFYKVVLADYELMPGFEP
jgi:hypothetical protein